MDTVGAVCMDRNGQLCAGASSGGVVYKVPGRIGQVSLSWRALSTKNCPSVPVYSHCQKRKSVMLSQNRRSCPVFSFFILDPSTRFLNHFIVAVIFANGKCQCQMTFLSLAFFFFTIGLLQGVQKFVSEDVNFVGIDFDPFSGLKKTLKFQFVVWASSSHIFVFLGPLLTWTVTHWGSELQKLVDQQENLLVPDYQIRLFLNSFSLTSCRRPFSAVDAGQLAMMLMK